MKSAYKTALAGLVLLGGTSAVLAQDVIIAPEQEVVYREYVRSEPVASISLPGFELNLGATVPQEAEIYTVRDQPYRYTVVDDRTVLVDPDTRRVVHIIE